MNWLKPEKPLVELLAVQFHSTVEALRKRNPCLPAQVRQAAHIQLFLRGAVRLTGIQEDRPLVSRGRRHCFGQVADRQIHASCAHIEELMLFWP